MLLFGIQLVKSNQYSNKCFLFWLGLFSLAFDFLTYLQEWTLRKIFFGGFSFWVHSWRIKKVKGMVFGGRTSPGPAAVLLCITVQRSDSRNLCSTTNAKQIPSTAPLRGRHRKLHVFLFFTRLGNLCEDSQGASPWHWLRFRFNPPGGPFKSTWTLMPGNCWALSRT